MRHLAWMLGVRDDQRSGKKTFPDLFRRYELKVDGANSSWRNDCAEDLEKGGTDLLERCAARKLQALASLCAGPPREVKVYRRGLKAAMWALIDEPKDIPFLGILRDALPPPYPRDKAEGFVFRSNGLHEDGGEGKRKTLRPVVQAVAMAAAVRCGEALGNRDPIVYLERWFVAAERSVKLAEEAEFGRLNHQELATIWHNLAFAASRAPKAIAASSEKVVQIVEKEMWKQFNEGEEVVWPYEGAVAIALRMNQTGLKKKVQKRLRNIASSYKKRFLKQVLPEMNLRTSCACGPVIGLAQLAVLLKDTKLTKAVIKLITKDVKLLHVRLDDPSFKMPSWFEDAPDRPHMEGAFLRSAAQLERQSRPQTVRIDDTRMCLDAARAALRMVEALPDADVDKLVAKATEGEEEDGAPEEDGDAAATGTHTEL